MKLMDRISLLLVPEKEFPPPTGPDAAWAEGTGATAEEILEALEWIGTDTGEDLQARADKLQEQIAARKAAAAQPSAPS